MFSVTACNRLTLAAPVERSGTSSSWNTPDTMKATKGYTRVGKGGAIGLTNLEGTSAGYHAQVLATANSFPLFLHDEQGGADEQARAEFGRFEDEPTQPSAPS